MDTQGKLAYLADVSQYDISCACGGRNADHRRRGGGGVWVYPTSVPRGGDSIMLKTLLSSACVNDCRYCPLRAGCDVPRHTLAAEELAEAFMGYVRRGGIHGMFLSSGVVRDADYTMDRMLAVLKTLRRRHEYRGFLHLKIIPGCSDAAIEESLRTATTVSLNVEAPTRASFAPLSSRKDFDRDIVRPMKLLSRLTARGGPYERVKVMTQFMVGASTETDRELVGATFGLYRRLGLARVYFSAYQRGLGEGDLPGERKAGEGSRQQGAGSRPEGELPIGDFRLPIGSSDAGAAIREHSGKARDEDGAQRDLLTREHRLYQADFLIRKYRWAEGDFQFAPDGSLPLGADPKLLWAEAHPEFFPVRLGRASRDELLRVPGIGPTTAERILKVRRDGVLGGLADAGVRGKRLATARKYVVAE